MKKGIYLAITICAISTLVVGCGINPTSSSPVLGSDPATTTPTNLLVDGNATESLMGNVELDHPLTH